MSEATIGYLYMVVYRAHISIHGSYPTTFTESLEREFLEFPFKLETTDAIPYAEHILLEKIKNREEQDDKTGYYTTIDKCEIIGVYPMYLQQTNLKEVNVMSDTKMYKYLIGFMFEQFIPVAAGAKIGQMKERTCSEVVNLPFQIHSEEDLIKAKDYMIQQENLNVERILSFSPLDR